MLSQSNITSEFQASETLSQKEVDGRPKQTTPEGGSLASLCAHIPTHTRMHATHMQKINGWGLERSLPVLHYTFLSPCVVSPTNSVPITSSDYAKFSILSIKHRILLGHG